MNLKKYLTLGVATTVLAGCSLNNSASVSEQSVTNEKYRTVITTDGEVDDMNSMIRYLYYANEMDLEGIVLTSSTYHYAGDEEKGIEPYRWTGTDWIYEMIDAYGEIQPNLSKHAEGFPTADELKSITKIGNISNVGEMDEVTEGAKFLEELFLDDNDTPLYVQTWGGTNTTARALKLIEETYKGTDEWEEIQEKINKKLVLYIILDQDDSYSNYIAKSWPDLTIINDQSNFWHFAYAWQYHSDELNTTLKADWQKKYILTDNGPLMDMYAAIGDGKVLEGELAEEQRGSEEYLKNNPNFERYDFISEGDSPSYFYLLQNGLNSVDNPSYGGWGGRFGSDGDKLFRNTVLDYNPYSKRFEAEYSLTRWFDDIQNDFAARIQWGTATEYSKANHTPSVSVNEGTHLIAKVGQEVKLTAKADDPDGDELTYRWWRYFEADTYTENSNVPKVESLKAGDLQLSLYRELGENEVVDPVELTGADTNQVSFTVPKDAKSGDTFHMIVEVQDNGEVPLKAYQRVVITVE
ncbi:TPA: nucleoside hydrolase-like domain-containing protein [Streptococcus suis]